MNNIVNVCKTVFAAIGGVLGAFLGGADGFIIALLVFVVLDYISGVVLAITRKELSSEVGFKGIAKKVFIFCLVGVGNLIDTQVLGAGSVMRMIVIFFYLSNEGISLIENVSALGLPVPQKLKDVLAQLNKSDDEGEDK